MNRNITPLLESSHRRRYLKISKSSYRGAGNVSVTSVVKGVVAEVGGRGVGRSIARIVPFFGNAINTLLHGRIPQGGQDFLRELKGVGAGGLGAARTSGGSRRGRRDDRWGATLEAGAASVMMAGGEAGALRTLVETAVLFLMTLTMTDKAGVIESWMRWEEDGVSLVEEGFSSVSSLLGFLGT